MDSAIVVALIGLVGSVLVAILNHKLTNQVKLQKREIVWLKTLIALVVSEYERTHLRSLAADGPFNADVKPGSTFEWELRHLTSLGLIARHPGKGIGRLFSQSGRRDVKEHVFITPQGKEYLRMVDEAKASQI